MSDKRFAPYSHTLAALSADRPTRAPRTPNRRMQLHPRCHGDVPLFPTRTFPASRDHAVFSYIPKADRARALAIWEKALADTNLVRDILRAGQGQYQFCPGEGCGRLVSCRGLMDATTSSTSRPVSSRSLILTLYRCPCGTDFCYVCGEPYSNGFFSCEHRYFTTNFEREWRLRVPAAMRAEMGYLPPLRPRVPGLTGTQASPHVRTPRPSAFARGTRAPRIPHYILQLVRTPGRRRPWG